MFVERILKLCSYFMVVSTAYLKYVKEKFIRKKGLTLLGNGRSCLNYNRIGDFVINLKW